MTLIVYPQMAQMTQMGLLLTGFLYASSQRSAMLCRESDRSRQPVSDSISIFNPQPHKDLRHLRHLRTKKESASSAPVQR
jgi:hypothetical protein